MEGVPLFVCVLFPFAWFAPPLFLKHTYIDYSVTLYSMPWIQYPQTTRPHRCVAQSSVEP